MLRRLQLKNIVFFLARFAELSESQLSTILEEKKAENTKKQLKLLRGYLQEKGLTEAELSTSKVKLANACICQIKLYFF